MPPTRPATWVDERSVVSLITAALVFLYAWRNTGDFMGIPFEAAPAFVLVPVLLSVLSMWAIRRTRLDLMHVVPAAERFTKMLDALEASPRVAGYRDKIRIAMPAEENDAETEAAEAEAAEAEAAAQRSAFGESGSP